MKLSTSEGQRMVTKRSDTAQKAVKVRNHSIKGSDREDSGRSQRDGEKEDNRIEKQTVADNGEALKVTEADESTSAVETLSNDLEQRSGSALPSISSSAHPIDTVCPWEKFENMQYYTQPSNATYDIPPDFLEFQKAKSLIDKPCKWKVCLDKDGNKFWCDGCRAVREKPQEVEDYEKAEALVARGNKWKVRDSGVYYNNGVMSVWKEPPELTDYQDKLAKFKELLREKKITLAMHLDDIDRLCCEDSRWNLLSENFRRQWITDLQTKRRKEEASEVMKDEKAKRGFLDLLGSYYLDESTQWLDIREKICNDPRYEAVDDEYRRKYLFRGFIEEIAKKHRKYKDDRLAPARKRFTELLEGGAVPIGVTSCWSDVEMPLEEMCDVNPIFEDLDLAERQRLLESYVRRLRSEEECARLAIEILEKQDRKVITDKILDSFEVFVREQVDAGVLNAESWWFGEFEETVKHEDYYSVMQNLCDDPYALEGRFYNVIDNLAPKEQQEEHTQHDDEPYAFVRSASQERGEKPIAVAGGTGLYVYVSEEDRKIEKPKVVFKKKPSSNEKVKRNQKKPERDYGGDGSDEGETTETVVKPASKPAIVPKLNSSVVIGPRQHTTRAPY